MLAYRASNLWSGHNDQQQRGVQGDGLVDVAGDPVGGELRLADDAMRPVGRKQIDAGLLFAAVNTY